MNRLLTIALVVPALLVAIAFGIWELALLVWRLALVGRMVIRGR